MADELWRSGAAELAGLIRKREVATRDVVDAHLRRIEAVNGSVHAITVTLADAAVAAAERADALLAGGGEVPPLHGVPFTVKENIDVTGSATTQGLVAFEGALPDLDAPHITQLRAAGAIPLAGSGLADRFPLAYRQRPARPDLEPVGRVAVAGRLERRRSRRACHRDVAAPDGQRLRRVPARPRPVLRHLVPAAHARPGARRDRVHPRGLPDHPAAHGRGGPDARRVADLRLALQHMCGDDPRDPWWAPAPLDGPSVPLRVAVWRGADEPDVAAGVDAAARALADAGYDIDEVDPPMVGEAARLWGDLVASDARMLVAMLRSAFGADALRFIDTFFELCPDLDKAGYVEGLAARQGAARAWSRFHAAHPLILGPVSTRSPFPVGRDLEGPAAVDEIMESMRLVVAVNLLGLPAAAVPVGVSGGLPQGVQLIGPRYREDLCLDAAQAIEDRLGIPTPSDPV